MGQWEAAGAPAMSAKRWAKRCMRVAANGRTRLESIMDVAKRHAV